MDEEIIRVLIGYIIAEISFIIMIIISLRKT